MTTKLTDTRTTGLDVQGLSAGYGAGPVVTELSLHVDPGEVVAMLGRNGAGKTTTLMALGGFLKRSAGVITIDGVAVGGPPHRRMRGQIGLVLEGRSVFAPLTTAQNLKVGRVGLADALRVFPDLEGRLHVRAGNLSGGEQQMLSLARAMCRRPRVLLLDELSFGLAPVICDRLFSGIRQFATEHGIAVIVVEQHLHYAAMVADRAMVMNQGRIALELPSSELLSRAGEIERLYLGGPDVGGEQQTTPPVGS
ncbi:ATP-binding cassette domain-containing protein [Dactylosporangium sp. AC04546]|uniref:ABC transporter ATP-binding protein n=1 Tax=Dactylosporangium sp. AC04546 TaxID=2862460 RepID=UPI001EE14292|nr:ATP-binding cassette domain-containing protein [Dactylosporangium sp. AC04546]WVK86918.1 ATP-binding cassette domain-containing protein [Dactylosporangium sp. AC04546]